MDKSFFLSLFIICIIIPPVSGDEQEIVPPNICVQGIIYDEENPIAVTNYGTVQKNDIIQGVKILKINKTSIQFEYKNNAFIKKIGEGCEKLNQSTCKKASPIPQKKKKDYSYNSYSDKLYQRAKDYYNKATKEYLAGKYTRAYIYYKKAIKYAQWAIPLVYKEKRKKMEQIVIDSRNKKIRLEKKEEKKIASINYPRLRSPEEISRWLKNNIVYKKDWELHGKYDYWQTPKETIILGAGDCEDFAFLAQALLKKIGINSSVIAIYFKEENKILGHAICIFPKNGPYYNYFSGSNLHRVNKKTILELVEEKFPTWVSIKELNLDKASHHLLFERSTVTKKNYLKNKKTKIVSKSTITPTKSYYNDALYYYNKAENLLFELEYEKAKEYYKKALQKAQWALEYEKLSYSKYKEIISIINESRRAMGECDEGRETLEELKESNKKLSPSPIKSGKILRVKRETTQNGWFFTIKYKTYAPISERVKVTLYCYFYPSGEGEYERIFFPIKYNVRRGFHETEMFLPKERGKYLNNFKALLYINGVLVDTKKWR